MFPAFRWKTTQCVHRYWPQESDLISWKNISISIISKNSYCRSVIFIQFYFNAQNTQLAIWNLIKKRKVITLNKRFFCDTNQFSLEALNFINPVQTEISNMWCEIVILYHFSTLRRKMPHVCLVISIVNISFHYEAFSWIWKTVWTCSASPTTTSLTHSQTAYAWIHLLMYCVHLNAAASINKFTLQAVHVQTSVSGLCDRRATTLHLSFCSIVETAPLITYITALLTYN